MIRVFYVGGSPSFAALLRTVLTETDFEHLKLADLRFIGSEFPHYSKGDRSFTVIEKLQGVQPGYYRCEIQPLQFEELLRDSHSSANA